MVGLGKGGAGPLDGGPGNVDELWIGHAPLMDAGRAGLGDNVGAEGEDGELRGGHALNVDDGPIQGTVLEGEGAQPRGLHPGV